MAASGKGLPARRSPSAGASAAPPQQEADPPPETAALEPAVEVLRPFLRDPAQASQAVARMVTAVRMFRGPLPPPTDFKGYNDVVPGSGREILDMAKGEQLHRHKMQYLEMIYPYLGWFAGFVCFLTCIAGSVYLAMNDRETIAGLLLGVPCLGVIGWFLNSRVSGPVTTTKDGPKPPAKRAPKKRR
jgi:uncharacterized membrane protein